MTAIQLQGRVFISVALLAAAAALLLPAPPEAMQLPALAALILVLGVPHGGLDTIFAHKLYGVQSLRGWALFALAYLVPVALVIALWRVAPLVFLLGFLIISIAHFSGDPEAGTPAVTRILYGGLIIVLPPLLHAPEVTRLFAFLVNPAAAAAFVPWLKMLALPWLVCSLLAALLSWKSNHRLQALEIAAAALLAILAAPLVAFTFFFCAMHSPRHILRTIRYSQIQSQKRLLVSCLAPMAGVLLLLALAAFWFNTHPIPLAGELIQLLFVGLAALTVPHMLLVERVTIGANTLKHN
jgi:Brp/Blh family beta-carotene 15,15'-monooxygenase